MNECPHCGLPMVYLFTDYNKNIEIWKCRQCLYRLEIKCESSRERPDASRSSSGNLGS